MFKTDAGDLRPRLCLLVVIGVTEDGVKELLALRTTNPVGSRFATVKLRTRVTKGAGSKAAALGMAYKLLRAAEERWRRFNGHELVTDILAGQTFKDGIRIPDEHPDTTDGKVAA